MYISVFKFMLVIATTALVLGCDKPNQIMSKVNQKIDHREDSAITRRDQQLQDNVNEHTAIINEDTVILADGHLSSVKTARYQPSFSLKGVITPAQHTTLKSMSDATIDAILVNVGDAVKHGQALITLSTITPAQADDSQNKKPYQIITITAPFDGIIDSIDINQTDTISTHTPLISLSDVSKYQFISHLPSNLQSHIQIGNTVDLTVHGRPFSGQVALIETSPSKQNTIDVYVKISPTKENRNALKSGQIAKGIIEYGQIEVGALVPDFAIIGENLQPLNLAQLYAPPHKPLAPIPAYAWVVKQDTSLKLAKIHVIEYQTTTRRFLVSGITDDSLLVLTNLPKDANGKRAVID